MGKQPILNLSKCLIVKIGFHLNLYIDFGLENLFDFQAIVARLNDIQDIQSKLVNEVDAEGAKYGDDVKYLADFTSGIKKFDPWIQKSEAKKAVGMIKPGSLQEALDQMEDAKVKWN